VGEVEELTGARFEAGVGVEGLPAMAGGGGRWSCCLGELPAWEKRRVAR
jgi:hypothetical protein